MADLYLLSYATAGGASLGVWLTWKATHIETMEDCTSASCLPLALTEQMPCSPSAQPWMEIVGEISGVCCREEGGADWLWGKVLEEMTTCSEEPPFILQCSGKGSFQILAVAKGHG